MGLFGNSKEDVEIAIGRIEKLLSSVPQPWDVNNATLAPYLVPELVPYPPGTLPLYSVALYRNGQTVASLTVESPNEIAKKLASVHGLLTMTPNVLKVDRVVVPGMQGKWVRVRAANGLMLALVPA